MEMVMTIETALARQFVCAHEAMSLNGCRGDDTALALSVKEEDGPITAAALLATDNEELTILHWAAESESGWPLMNAVVVAASARRCTRVRGEFVSTGANEAMREYLAQFGFTMIGEDETTTLWILPVSAYEPMG
jgi:hypothetical protein